MSKQGDEEQQVDRVELQFSLPVAGALDAHESANSTRELMLALLDAMKRDLGVSLSIEEISSSFTTVSSDGESKAHERRTVVRGARPLEDIDARTLLPPSLAEELDEDSSRTSEYFALLAQHVSNTVAAEAADAATQVVGKALRDFRGGPQDSKQLAAGQSDVPQRLYTPEQRERVLAARKERARKRKGGVWMDLEAEAAKLRDSLLRTNPSPTTRPQGTETGDVDRGVRGGTE